jgi:hypothetical protein
VGCGFGTLESFAEVRRVLVEGDDRRLEGRGDIETPSLSATGEAAEGEGLAFSKNLLLTLRDVNFLGGAPEAGKEVDVAGCESPKRVLGELTLSVLAASPASLASMDCAVGSTSSAEVVVATSGSSAWTGFAAFSVAASC